jgi:hypothetical protein
MPANGRNRLYLPGQDGTSPAATSSYDWGRFSVIADIGGGLGVQLGNILDAFPSCHGILFDQPNVVEQAISHERMERIGGNFFNYVPAGADLYILNGVIHDWTDSESLTILGNVRQAMRPDARLAILDDIITETPQFSFGKWLDLLMLAVPGGRERTEAEFLELLRLCRLRTRRGRCHRCATEHSYSEGGESNLDTLVGRPGSCSTNWQRSADSISRTKVKVLETSTELTWRNSKPSKAVLRRL